MSSENLWFSLKFSYIRLIAEKLGNEVPHTQYRAHYNYFHRILCRSSHRSCSIKNTALNVHRKAPVLKSPF